MTVSLIRGALVTALVIATVAIAGCSGGSSPSLDSSTPSGDGPLSVAGGGGGSMVFAAKASGAATRAVFGGLLMCTRGGVPLTITDVTFDSDVPSAEVRDVVRSIPEAADRDHPDSMWWSPISGLRGDVLGPRLRRRLGGEITEEVKGFVVDLPCAKRRPGDALLELMTSVAAQPEGASVRSQTIAYEAGGRRYTVEVPWRLVICGPSVDDDLCAGMTPID